MKFVRTKQAQPGTELGSFIPVNENSIENHISSVGNILTLREKLRQEWLSGCYLIIQFRIVGLKM